MIQKQKGVILATAMILGLAILLMGCDKPLPNPSVMIVSHYWKVHKYYWGDYWRVNVEGIAINDGNRHLYYVEIKARIYTATGEVIGECDAKTHTLPKGGKWNFWMKKEITVEPARYDIWVEETKW